MKSIFYISLILIFLIGFVIADDQNPVESRSVTLDESISIAMELNHQIRAQKNEIEATEAAVKQAKAAYLFNLSVTGEMSQIQTFPEPDPIEIPGLPPDLDLNFGMSSNVSKSLSFNLVQPIYTFGLIPASIKASNAALDSKKAEFDQLKHDIALSVIESFYGVYLSTKAVEIRKDEIDRSEIALNYAQRKYEVGQSPKFDVIRSEVDLARAKEQLVSARKYSKIALLAFQRLLGLDEPVKPDFEGTLEIPEWSIPLEECLEIALKTRPEIKQIQFGIKSLQQVIVLNRLRPQLNFIGNLKYSDQASSGFSGKNSFAWFVQFQVPIFDGNKSRHSVNEAQSNRDALKDRLNDTITLIRLDVESSFLALDESMARVESSERILAQANEALRMAEIGYREGVVTYLDLVSSRNQYTQLELNHLAALTDKAVAFAKMLKSIGLYPMPSQI